jgi:hypothetical protein
LQKTLSLSVSSSQAATGKREVGEKARGEITIFNKLDKPQNITKGLILSDSSGKKFEIANNLQIPGSSYNLDNGTITMGQIKANLIAVDIGPEFNLPTNTQLNSSSSPDIIAKTTKELTGGTRQEVLVVSADDRRLLLEQARTELKNKAKEQIKSESKVGVVIFDNTAYFDNQKSDFNREVGEVTDTLTVNLSANVSYLYLDLAKKNEIVNFYLGSNSDFQNYDLATGSFDFGFASTNVSNSKSSGNLTITSKVNPKIDVDLLRKQLAKKKNQEVKSIVSKIPRFYNYTIENNLKLLNWVGFLPLDFNRITVIIKN